MLGHRSDIRVPEDCMYCYVNGRKTGGVTFFLVFRGKDGSHGNKPQISVVYMQNLNISDRIFWIMCTLKRFFFCFFFVTILFLYHMLL